MNDVNVNLPISKHFDNAMEQYNRIENSDLPSNSPELQEKITATISLLEKLTIEVSHLGLFSANESLEEITTGSMKFLLLPVLLGSLSLKRIEGPREEVCRMASIYYRDFVKRCKEYGITDVTLPTEEDNLESCNEQKLIKKGMPSVREINASSNQREQKIQRYKEKKSLENKIKELKCALDNPSHDEEVVREYFIATIKHFILLGVDEISSIAMEAQMLKRIGEMKLNGEEVIKKKEPKKGAFKPFLITKDAVQKAVFGAGYPSLPVLTVDEFYEKRVKEGWFPNPDEAPQPTPCVSKFGANEAPLDANSEEDQEAIEKEKIEEEDDQNDLERLRERDEWRDTHRTGWGNTYKRS